MEHEHRLVDFLARERRLKREPDRWYLHTYLKNGEIPKNSDADAKCHCLLDTLPPSRQVSWPIVDYLTKVGLYGPIFTHLSQLPGPPSEEMARVFEELQYRFCERQDYLLYWLWDRPGPPARQKLDSFRLAQKIRNEQGFSLCDRPQICFRSFEDLVQLERSIEADDAVDFLLQGVDLKKMDTDAMTYSTMDTNVMKMSMFLLRNLPQLNVFHDGAMLIDPRYSCMKTAHLYGYQFRYLTSEERGAKPTWLEVKKYLKTAGGLGDVGDGANMLCGADILDEELDEALNCLLNNCVRTKHNFGRHEDGVQFLKQLLDRGASLCFRGADERSSSIAALLTCDEYYRGLFPLSEFSSYICCPLFNNRGYSKISFDSRRLASLSCLAARKIPRPENASELPPGLRFFIEAHQELQFRLK